jgi:hypothetical protein
MNYNQLIGTGSKNKHPGTGEIIFKKGTGSTT